jgi:hypothetical protein
MMYESVTSNEDEEIHSSDDRKYVEQEERAAKRMAKEGVDSSES